MIAKGGLEATQIGKAVSGSVDAAPILTENAGIYSPTSQGGRPIVPVQAGPGYSAGDVLPATPAPVGSASVATNVAPFTPLTDGGGLQVYEDAGGHLIARHVGMSEADLANRLATSKVSSASTFADRATAETAVSAAIDLNKSAIQNYLSGNSNGYLALEYTSPTPVGTSLTRGATSATSVNGVRVVIAKDPTMSTGFRIVTGYPHQ